MTNSSLERANLSSPVRDGDRAAAAVRELLLATGVDPDETRLVDTPRRVAESFLALFAGVGRNAGDELRGGEPYSGGASTIVLQNITFVSTCAHHLLPFSGVAHLAYVPGSRLVGIGGFKHALDVLSQRPQLQEDLTQSMADTIVESADARGALVILEARHGCIADRGALQTDSRLVTSASCGVLDDAPARLEALALLGRSPA